MGRRDTLDLENGRLVETAPETAAVGREEVHLVRLGAALHSHDPAGTRAVRR